MKTQQYDLLSRRLHSIMAVVIIYTLITGYISHYVPSDLAHIIGSINVSITTLITPLFIIRYFWTFFRKSPQLPSSIPLFQRNIAKLWHSFLYLIIFIVLTSGFLMMTHPFHLFWLFKIDNIIANQEVNKFFYVVHIYSCYALVFALSVHIFAVIKHVAINKNKVINLMF